VTARGWRRTPACSACKDVPVSIVSAAERSFIHCRVTSAGSPLAKVLCARDRARMLRKVATQSCHVGVACWVRGQSILAGSVSCEPKPAAACCRCRQAIAVAIMSRPRRALLLLMATTFVARLAFASALGLGVDESYTVATARQLQLGYFEHPPMAWWLTWAARRLFNGESALALRLPFILLFALSTWLMFVLASRLYGERAGFWAAATLNLAPVIAWTSGTWILPDGPLDAALLAGACCLAAALFDRRGVAPLWWLAAGGCGGMALLSKLHGVFLFSGAGLFLITSAPHRRWLTTPWPYAGAALAFVIFQPVIVWNIQHEWVMFAFQAGRAHAQGFNPSGPFLALAGQAVYLLPWLWLPLVACLAKALLGGPMDERRWLMACLACGPIAAFTAVGITGARVLPHWAAPGYLMLFPLLGAHVAKGIARGEHRVRRWLLGSTASVVIVLVSVIAMARLPWPLAALPGAKASSDPLLESINWSDLERELAASGLLGRPRLFITATRWHEAAKIDYALHGRMPVLCICRDPRGYGVLTDPATHFGEDALIIGRDLSRERVEATYNPYFESIEDLPSVRILRAGSPAFDLSIFLARKLRPSGKQPSLLNPLSQR